MTLWRVLRGGTESTRHAVQLINALIQDPAKELEDLIPRNHIRMPGTKMGSTFTTATGATSTTAAGSKGLPSVVPSSGVSFQASSSAASQGGAKGGKSLAPGVRPPFVSLPLAYAHPQLALLAAQTMHQIRHPRLPMAQFGGTFAPSPGTWGPFPVRPVSPGSANSSPKHNGGGAGPPAAAAAPRPGPAHPAEHHPAPTASGPPPLAGGPAPSSSVRKQLFSEPKAVSAAVAAATAAVTSAAARPSGSPAPLVSAPPTTPPTPPPPPPPIAPPPSQQAPPPKPEPGPPATPGKEKPTSEQQATPTHVLAGAPEGPGALPFQTPLPSLASHPPPQPESRQPPLPMSFAPADPPAPPTSALPTPRPSAPSVSHAGPALPHYTPPGPAPRPSPRVQPAGPFYPLAPGAALQEPPSVYNPPAGPQEPLKQQQQQQGLAAPGMAPPPSLQMSSAIGVLNGSQMHLHPAGKAQLPPNFGPAALFNHFSSMFDGSQVGNSQVWGACHLPARTPPEQAYGPPPAYMAGMGQMEGVLPPPDGSKAPGYRCGSQRMVNSPIGERRDPHPSMFPFCFRVSAAVHKVFYLFKSILFMFKKDGLRKAIRFRPLSDFWPSAAWTTQSPIAVLLLDSWCHLYEICRQYLIMQI